MAKTNKRFPATRRYSWGEHTFFIKLENVSFHVFRNALESFFEIHKTFMRQCDATSSQFTTVNNVSMEKRGKLIPGTGEIFFFIYHPENSSISYYHILRYIGKTAKFIINICTVRWKLHFSYITNPILLYISYLIL